MSQLVRIRLGGPPAKPPASPLDGITSPTPDAPGVYLETFGCQMNEADSALILGQLAAAGYVRVSDPGKAAVVLVNTCAIREKAEDRVWGRTSQLLSYRAQNPDMVLGVTGCMAEHLREKVSQRAPYIGLVAGPDSYRNIAALVERARAGETVMDVHLDREEVYEGLDGLAQDDGVSGQVTIQRGCDKFCSFCVVPYTRGRERAVPPREVLRAVRRLAEAGYREVVLLGQTVNSYRHEQADFAGLLRAVAQVDGIARIRFVSPYPRDMSDELIATMAELPQVCPQVHLPAQSGSDAVLERMGRGYTRAEFVDLVGALRRAIPDVALSTDIMVGFCGETEAQHQETLGLMREVRFDTAFMFRYSDRGITQAARKLDDDVPDAVKARRLTEVIDLQEGHTRAACAAWVGRRVQVLVTGPARRPGQAIGRSPHFHQVFLPLAAGRAGELVEVDIVGTTGRSLIAAGVSAPA